MSFAISQVKQPLGSLELALFPGDTVESFDDRLEGYVDDAEAKATANGVLDADLDAAIEAWVYYRAYTAIGTRLLAAPRTAAIEGQASRRYEQEQADGFFALAGKWRNDFDGLIPEPLAPDPVSVPSASFRNVYEW